MTALRNRYLISGTLEMLSGLHIGSGRDSYETDSPVIRDAHGIPFIPGSSMKGVLRSRIEKLIPVLSNTTDLASCQLYESGTSQCLSLQTNQKRYRDLLDEASNEIPVKKSQALSPADISAWPEKNLRLQMVFEKYLPANLCDSCRLFGSPLMAAKFKVRDLQLVTDYAVLAQSGDLTETRDGVGIDRDSETAAHGAKYDFEAVSSQCRFECNFTLENVNDQELAIAALAVRELVEGYILIGGFSSRGLGHCKLEINDISYIDFGNQSHVQQFLLDGKLPAGLTSAQFFDNIASLISRGGETDA